MQHIFTQNGFHDGNLIDSDAARARWGRSPAHHNGSRMGPPYTARSSATRLPMPTLSRAHLLRLLRWLGLLALCWVALSWLLVLVLRFVPPWTSAVMLERQVGAWMHGEKDFQLRHRWVPWDEVSP